MKVNMDEEMLAYQLRKNQEEKPSMGQWIIIIALGIFIGNMGSWGSQRAIDNWLLQQAIEDINKQTSIQKQINNERLEKQQKLSAEQAKKRHIDLQKKQAGFRQASETCNFWNQQLAKENTAQNRMNREQACNLVNRFR
ncbi:MAG: hypothetical protein ACKE9I_07275 [Methylophagaceae bacterium]